jgi:hypothetical protein
MNFPVAAFLRRTLTAVVASTWGSRLTAPVMGAWLMSTLRSVLRRYLAC